MTGQAGAGAETLRRAASLMRERAEGATPGPWVGVGEATCTAFYWDREPEPQYGARIMANGSTHWLSGTRLSDGARAKADAEHVASWHPAVALAVADWLDEVAWRSEHIPKQYRGATAALAVARAYLGEQP